MDFSYVNREIFTIKELHNRVSSAEINSVQDNHTNMLQIEYSSCFSEKTHKIYKGLSADDILV